MKNITFEGACVSNNTLNPFFIFQEFTWATFIMLSANSIGSISFILILSGHHTLGWTGVTICMMYQHVPSFLSTLWVPRRVKSMPQWNGGRHLVMRLEMEHSSGDFRRTLRGILIDEQKCEAFIDWMYQEFSSEVILSFLEFVQFRKFVKEAIGDTDGSDISAEPDRYDFMLYDGMPQSTIVYDSFQFDQVTSPTRSPSNAVDIAYMPSDTVAGTSPSEDPLRRCKRIAHLFFKKYIEYKSEQEINISGRLRYQYFNLEQSRYDGMNLNQFVTLYDEVIAEMMKYQSQSYQRFQRVHQK